MNTDTPSFEELETKVVQWAEDRSLFDKASAVPQLDKTQEEYLETRDAVVKFNTLREIQEKYAINLDDEILDTREEIEDGLGDVLVTLIIFAKLSGLGCVSALETAYNVIKNRKGKTVDGIFIKDTE